MTSDEYLRAITEIEHSAHLWAEDYDGMPVECEHWPPALKLARSAHDLLDAAKSALSAMDLEWGECGCVGEAPDDITAPQPCTNCLLRAAIAKATADRV